MENQTQIKLKEDICDTLDGKNIYKCGHITNGVIVMDDNILSMTAWVEWSDTVGIYGTMEQCFDCYLKEKIK